jgi:hypothetical protein
MLSGTGPASTLAHIALIRAKRDRLEQAQLDAEAAYLRQIIREHDGDPAALLECYAEFIEVALPGSTGRFSEAVGLSISTLTGHARLSRLGRPNSADGRTWHGVAPLSHRESAPRHGVPVVYVLFDADLVPCYVGSSAHFRDRLKAHIKDGKPVTAWTAYPCVDREAAYTLEDRLLREYKPYLNRKASR